MFDDGDPLAGMAAVPWSQLEHAYGEASNVPHLLSATRRARQATDDAVAELFHTIWHQGTVYSATVAAVPFIAAMAADDNIRGDVRSELVFLLFLIARGEGYYQVHQHILRRLDHGLPDDLEARLTHERDVVAGCVDAVAREVPHLIERTADQRLPSEFWCTLSGLAAITGAPTDTTRQLLDRLTDGSAELLEAGAEVLRQLDRLTDGSAELLEAGAEVLRQLAASGTATADTVRAAAELDEELVYYFDHNLSVVNPVTRDDYFVVLLIERMAAVGTA